MAAALTNVESAGQSLCLAAMKHATQKNSNMQESIAGISIGHNPSTARSR